jgi:hypothetical protein
MGAYGSAENDTVAYGSGIWVRTHDAWVLREEHGMVRMLLTRHTVQVYQYWMYGRVQGGHSWYRVDQRGRRSSKEGG